MYSQREAVQVYWWKWPCPLRTMHTGSRKGAGVAPGGSRLNVGERDKCLSQGAQGHSHALESGVQLSTGRQEIACWTGPGRNMGLCSSEQGQSGKSFKWTGHMSLRQKTRPLKLPVSRASMCWTLTDRHRDSPGARSPRRQAGGGAGA